MFQARGIVLAGLVLSGVAVAGAAQTTAPVAAPATASRPATRTMEFKFENASVDAVLDEMSARLGFVIQKTVPLAGKVSVMAPAPVDADEAITLLNSVLVPLGYAAIERPSVRTMNGTTARVLRIMTWSAAKKEAPLNK